MFNEKGKIDFESLYSLINNQMDIGIYYNDVMNMGDVQLVRKVNEKVVEEISVNDMFQDVKKYAQKNYPENNLSDLYSDARVISNSFYRKFRNYKIDTFRDDEKHIHLFFKNGVVKISADDVELIDWKDIDTGGNYIWKDNISKRQFDIDKIEDYKGDWYRFAENAVGEMGMEALMSSQGYMLHSYKDPTVSKMIVYAEGNEDRMNEANGRSGKSLLAYNALSKLRKCNFIEGKRFVDDSQFSFQTVDPRANIVVLDDVSKNFKYESLYNAVTNQFSIERKRMSPIVLEYSKSPKFIITSNYGIFSTGDSDKGRREVIGFTNHYNANHTPKDEFGKRFFYDWNAKDYHQFYSFYIKSSQYYLKNGLKSYKSELIDRKALIAIAGSELYGHIEDNVNDYYSSTNQKSWNMIIGSLPGTEYMDEKKIKYYFEKIINHLGYRLIERKSGGKRFRYIVKESEFAAELKNLSQTNQEINIEKAKKDNEFYNDLKKDNEIPF